ASFYCQTPAFVGGGRVSRWGGAAGSGGSPGPGWLRMGGAPPLATRASARGGGGPNERQRPAGTGDASPRSRWRSVGDLELRQQHVLVVAQIVAELHRGRELGVVPVRLQLEVPVEIPVDADGPGGRVLR